MNDANFELMQTWGKKKEEEEEEEKEEEEEAVSYTHLTLPTSYAV